MLEQRVECPNCDGYGYVNNYFDGLNIETVECEECHGIGYKWYPMTREYYIKRMTNTSVFIKALHYIYNNVNIDDILNYLSSPITEEEIKMWNKDTE